jgi:peptidoglycan/LPS O-acetylase OafA/YrhL
MRDDIQALRAFAVIAVLLFHVDLPFAAGGYLGVDIFFVISGFVITGLIRRELAAGLFSFRAFYIKRICRILPASTVTIALTLLVGAFVLATGDMKYLGASSVAALTSLSNVHFWQESGYFDEASHLKPLLHTWSLGVEEQFYLLWPAIMVFAFGRNRLALAIGVIGIASLIAAQALLTARPDAVFFLTPFRAFEFCAGAILHFLPAIRRSTPFYAGVAIMTGSAVWLDSSYAMPGLVSLVPVGGAMLCIAAGQTLPWRMPTAIVGIGNASYSIYLAHWPLIVFYKYLNGTHLAPAEQAGLLAASLVLGFLLNRTVERPMRPVEFWTGRVPRAAGAALFGGAALVAATAWVSDGWSWRVPPGIKTAMAEVPAFRTAWMSYMESNGNKSFRPNGRKILIIGDSHGQDLYNAILQNGGDNIVRLNVAYSCQPVEGDRPIEKGNRQLVVNNATQEKGCQLALRKLLRDPLIGQADVVILAARWKDWAIDRVPAVIALLRSQTKAPILVSGPQAEFEPIVPRLIEMHGALEGIDEAARTHEDQRRRALNERLRVLAEQAGATYLDKFALLCRRGACPVLIPGSDRLFIWDYGHWSIEGAKYFGAQLRAEPALARPIFVGG